VERPFLWGWATAAIVLFIVLLRIRAPRARGIALALFGFSAAMALAEGIAAAYLSRTVPITGQSSPQWVSMDDLDLGYALTPGIRVSASRTRADSMLYSVTYTITPAGVRRTRGDERGETWLFMGCSFTFGDGVEDDETLPSRFSEQLGWTANVVNLGVSGYGAHQVLRQLETGRLGGVTGPVGHVIYQALPAHVARAAGRFRWGLDGPRYLLSGQTVRYDGPLHGGRFIRAVGIARRSDLLSLLLDRWYFERAPTDREIELYSRIVERAGTLARKKLGADFTVLYWDSNRPESEAIFGRLVATGLPIVRTSALVPRDETDSLRIPYDFHPLPEGYRRLAVELAGYFRERR
jgi:hypothetical protein